MSDTDARMDQLAAVFNPDYAYTRHAEVIDAPDGAILFFRFKKEDFPDIATVQEAMAKLEIRLRARNITVIWGYDNFTLDVLTPEQMYERGWVRTLGKVATNDGS